MVDNLIQVIRLILEASTQIKVNSYSTGLHRIAGLTAHTDNENVQESAYHNIKI